MTTLTSIQKAIMTEIKNHNKSREYLNEFNKCIKFVKMDRYIKENYEEYTICSDEVAMVKFEVICSFKPAHKFENNIVKYMVNVYSDGTMGIYFDGTDYMA